MPLPGGAADKAGNSYERRSTVFALTDLLAGRAQTLRIEVPGDDGTGSEFRLIVDGAAQWHQVKRQRAAGPWTVNALDAEGVLSPWQANLARGEQCVFVSSTSADELRELADRARSATSWAEFNKEFLAAGSVRVGFERLQRAWSGLSEEAVFDALRQVTVRTIGESELADWNNDRLRSLVSGARPATVAAILGQLADDSVHHELSADDVWTYLAQHDVTPLALNLNIAVVGQVEDTAIAFLARLMPLYIGGQELHRPEVDTVLGHLEDGRRTILAGGAGAGKSAVVAQVVANARESQQPVLVISADRLPEAATSSQLGVELGLPDSPVAVLAGVAAEGDALLVIDQLDAVSITSGRHPERLGLISDLLREARSHPRLRVLLACRQFDLDNDRGLRAVSHDDDTAVVPLGDLDQQQVRQLVAHAELSTQVPEPLMRLLAVPLHLALYVELARAGVSDIGSARTLTQLYDRYWDAKRVACRLARDGADEWHPLVALLVQRMNERQELSVPVSVGDAFDQQVKVMASEGVLVVGDGRITFFHETFFDYCFARHFLASGGSLRNLVSASDQDLFHRAQVRQILAYERGADVTSYLADLGWLLSSSDVRLHLKVLVVALIQTVPSPTAQEWGLLRPIAHDSGSPLHDRLWQAIRNNPGLFPVLDGDGTWSTLLTTSDGLAETAVWAIATATADHAPRVIELLRDGPPEAWPTRRRWLLRVADVHRSRELVDLLLEALADGDFNTLDYELGHTLGQLAQAQPAWAAEVLTAFVSCAAADLDSNPFSASAIRGASREATAEIHAIARAAPGEYVDGILPMLLAAMQVNARPEWQLTDLIPDSLWSHHVYRGHARLRDDLYDAMAIALAKLAEVDPPRAALAFEVLRAEPYEAAAFLLAKGYAGNPMVFAAEAISWLTESPDTRVLGYADASAWVTRELVAAISPQCSSNDLEQLENALLYYAPSFERTYQSLRYRGLTELCLLNGIEPTRRTARVDRRLAELRRKLNIEDVHPPEGVTGGAVPPPIPEERARRMSDQHWLRAMERYAVGGRTEWRNGRIIGDAWSQSQVLETLTAEDPERFAHLLLRLPADTPEPYVSAILRGLAKGHIDYDLLLKVCRRAHAVGDSDTNRWLVRLIEANAAGPVSDQLIEMVVAVAIGDPDPEAPSTDEPWEGASVDDAALNSTRGAAALAISRLLGEEPARLPLLEAALRRLVVDPAPAVRSAAVGALAPVLYIDSDLAIDLLHQALLGAPVEVLGSRYVEHFLNHAVKTSHYGDVAEHLHEMLASPDNAPKESAARQTTLAAYFDEAVDSEVDTLLASDDVRVRAAAIQVFADNILFAARRERTSSVIAAAFFDPEKDVRDAAERVFYNLDDASLADYDELIAAFAKSPALSDGAAAALHSVEQSRKALPISILDVCEAFVVVHSSNIGDMRTSAAADVTQVVRLTLRMHAQSVDADTRRRCLDLIDQLLVLRAHGIESDLDAIER